MPKLCEPLFPGKQARRDHGNRHGRDGVADAAQGARKSGHQQGRRGRQLRSLVNAHALKIQKDDEHPDQPQAHERVATPEHRPHRSKKRNEPERSEPGILAAPFPLQADEEPHQERQQQTREAFVRHPRDCRREQVHGRRRLCVIVSEGIDSTVRSTFTG